MNLPIDFNIPFTNSRTHLSHAGHQCAPPLPSTSEAAAPAASSSSAPSQTPPSAAQAPATQLDDSLGATGAAPQPHEPPADATAAAISGQDAAAAPGHSAQLARCCRRRRCHIPERCTWSWRWQWPGQRLSRKQWEAQAILVSRRLLESAAQGPGDSVPAAEVHHQARSPQAGGTTESHRRSG